MKTVKRILLFIVAIIAILLIVAAFMKKEFMMKREITINKPKDQVFAYVKLLKSMDEYGVWSKSDPTNKAGFTGTDGTVGATTSWNGEDIGMGEQEIKAIDEGNKIDFELRFKKPMEGNNDASIITEAVGDNQTKVIWTMSGKTPYPFNLLSAMMMGTLEEQYDTGLKNMKAILEKQ
jgi:uncharacterized membrane protein